MRELLLVRHAKSSWDSGAVTDFDRPLGPRGLRDAPAMGGWLAERALVPDLVITSPALRARMTTQQILGAMDADEVEVREEAGVYGGGLRDLVRVLEELASSAGRAMLVGHNPGLDELVLWLAAAPPTYSQGGKLMTTCAVAHVTAAGDEPLLGPRAGSVHGIYRPREVL